MAIPTVKTEKIHVPAEYLKPCANPVFSGQTVRDWFAFTKTLQAARDVCASRLDAIKRWQENHTHP